MYFSNHCLSQVLFYSPKLLFIAHAFPKGLPLLHALPSFYVVYSETMLKLTSTRSHPLLMRWVGDSLLQSKNQIRSSPPKRLFK